MTLVDAAQLHIDVSLSETDAAKVAVGQPVTLTFDALPDAQITGRVATVAPVATIEQNVVTYAVQVAFDPGTTAVKVGMSATADIQVEQLADALLVPSRAIQTAGDSKTVTVQQGRYDGDRSGDDWPGQRRQDRDCQQRQRWHSGAQGRRYRGRA